VSKVTGTNTTDVSTDPLLSLLAKDKMLLSIMYTIIADIIFIAMAYAFTHFVYARCFKQEDRAQSVMNDQARGDFLRMATRDKE